MCDHSLTRSTLHIAFIQTLLSLALIAFNAPLAHSAEQLELETLTFTPDTSFVTLDKQVQYIQDAQHNLTIEDLLTDLTLLWASPTKRTLNFLYSDNVLWLRFSLNNPDTIAANWLLELEWPFIDAITLYKTVNGTLIETHQDGDHATPLSRPIQHRYPLLPVNMDAQETAVFFLKVQSSSSLLLPLTLWHQADFFHHTVNETLLLGMFFGMMTIFAIYNLFSWINARKTRYLSYVAYVLSVMFFQTTINGIGHQYFWTGSIWANDHSLAASVALSFITGALFMDKFLKLKSLHPMIHRTVYILVTTYIGLFLLSFFTTEATLAVFVQPMAIVSCILALMVSIYLVHQGNPSAKYFVTAWFVLALGTCAYTALLAGILPRNTLTQHAQGFGMIIEVIILAFALSSHYRTSHAAHRKAQELNLHFSQELNRTHEELLRVEKKNNELLESRVQQRTQELKKALHELSIVNNQLEQVSITDGLTNLYNRRHFDHWFPSEYRRSQRDKQTLTLLIADIDQFKNINDQFGHLIGDECIRIVSEILSAHCNRATDHVFRYGGEEFVVVLPNTRPAGASKIAESIRQTVMQRTVGYNDTESFSFTLSIGLISKSPSQFENYEQFIELADKALYKAKQSGRNRCCMANDTTAAQGDKLHSI